MEPFGFVRSHTLRTRCIQGRDGEPIKKATSRRGAESGLAGRLRATIPAMPSTPSRRSPRSIALVGLLAVVLLVAACGSPAARPSPSAADSPPPPAPSGHRARRRRRRRSPTPPTPRTSMPIYDAIEEQVVGRSAASSRRRPVERQFIDEAELRTHAHRAVRQDTPPAYVAANERLYKALGLIPARRRPARPDPRPAERRRRRLLPPRRGQALYVVSKTGRAGRRRADHLRPRVRPRAPGPATSVFKDQDGVLDQSDRIARPPGDLRGRRDLLMTLWAAEQPRPQAELARARSAGAATPSRPALLERMPRDPRETAALPVHDRPDVRPGAPGDGRLGRGRRVLRPDARVDRADPPSREVRGERGTRSTSTCPTTSPTRLGDGWSVAARGHVRRVPARDLAPRARASTARRPTTAAAGWGGDRLAVLDGPGGAWGVVLETDLGHGDATPPSSRTRRNAAVDGLADPARIVAPGADETRHGPHRHRRRRRCSAARRRLRRDRRLTPAPRAAYIDSGAEIPSSPSAFGERGPAPPRRAPAAPRSGPAASGSTTRASR